jgi:hypothetical protein
VQAYERHAARGGGRVVFFLCVALLAAMAAGAGEVLFPKPLHLTRRIEDPFSKTPIVVEEYCAGNRVVTVRGERVVIADYERQELTEIDRAAATYSITRFDEIARSLPPAETARVNTRSRKLPGDRFEFIVENSAKADAAITRTKIEVSVDRTVQLRKPALDVLLGAAYPYRPGAHHSRLMEAAGTGLPSEQITTYEFEGREVVTRSVITRVAEERVPPELVALPPGARRVESRFSLTHETAEELDRH